MINYRFAVGLLSLALGACANVQIAADGGKTHRYFGFVSVQVPKTEKAIQAYKISSLGFAIENGLLIGARDTEMVLVPLRESEGGARPNEATCSMVVIVRSSAEAEHARDTLKDLKGDNICLAEFQ